MPTIFAGDESGNLGFAFDKGATTHFVLALIRFEDADAARRMFEEFKGQRRLTGRDLSYHDLAIHEWSEIVFDFLGTMPFRSWVLAVNKISLSNLHRAMAKTNLYAFFVSEAISQIPLEQRSKCHLVLDEFDRSGKVITEITRILKMNGIERGFKKITAKRSASEPLLQIADLVAGSLS